MKVWLLRYQDMGHGTIQEWYGTKAEAMRRAKEVASEAQYVYSTKPELIPRRKQDLVHWLNIMCNRDNG